MPATSSAATLATAWKSPASPTSSARGYSAIAGSGHDRQRGSRATTSARTPPVRRRSPTGGNGVAIAGAVGNTIGGTTTGAGNVISGNTGDGVDITGSGTTGNILEGNYIGINAAGTSALLNGVYAVAIESGAQADVSGSVTGDVYNDGTLSLTGLGFLNITGNYTQTANGTLDMVLGGTDPGTFNQLTVTGVASLNGALDVSEIGGFVPSIGESFPILTFGSSTGAFTAYEGLAVGADVFLDPTYDVGDLTLDAIADPAPTVSPGGNVFATEGIAFTQTGSFTDASFDETFTASVDYGDGSGSHTLTLGAGNSFVLGNVYASPGAYVVTVTVKDSNGGTGGRRRSLSSSPPLLHRTITTTATRPATPP